MIDPAAITVSQATESRVHQHATLPLTGHPDHHIQSTIVSQHPTYLAISHRGIPVELTPEWNMKRKTREASVQIGPELLDLARNDLRRKLSEEKEKGAKVTKRTGGPTCPVCGIKVHEN